MPENLVCPQCHKPWDEKPGWGCRLLAHATASHNPRQPHETIEAPKEGWAVLEPDKELNPKTLTLLKELQDLPSGQRDALLTRAVPRYLTVISEVDVLKGQQPSSQDMVNVTGNLSSLWLDIIGCP